MFDGLRLSVAPPNAAPERTPLDRAVERYARAAGDILTARREGGTELPHQRAAFEKAGKALDVIEPNAARDMRSAFNRDNSLIDAADKGCTVNAIRAKMLEYEVRPNPALRADRFVEARRKPAHRERAHRDTFHTRPAATMGGK